MRTQWALTSFRSVAWCLALALGAAACSSDDNTGTGTGSPGGSGGSGGTAGTDGGGTAGTGDTAGAGGDGQTSNAGEDTTVTLFDGQIFSNATTAVYQDSVVMFPSEGTYESITLNLTLACPAGGCDPWDRYATLGILDPSEEDNFDNNLIEIARYITPYGVGGSWTFDLTDIRPLLSGEKTIRGFISTWAKGWKVTATVDFKGGTPAKEPLYVVPAWKLKYVVLGDPGKLVAAAAPPASVTLPGGASSVSMWSIITGHGQGNYLNCAEFCQQEHVFNVAGKSHGEIIWRDDCADNPVNPQGGNWQPNRAGWCPGADVVPWKFDVTESLSAEMLSGEAAVDLTYDVGVTYENTCRPGADPGGDCKGSCAFFNVGCDYDDNGHTEPYYKLSALVIGYK
jgi:hypothetical protein